MELAKGVRDFAPEEMQLRQYILRSITEQFVLFGFEPLETPILERMETLNAKMAGSDSTDVAKEIFKVEDQGGRELGLRFDLTVPLSRYVAIHKDLKLPFRRYEIGRVYRDGPIKLGRYREFIQCDADIIGSNSMLADADCVHLADAVFRSLSIPVTLKVNNRSVLDAVCNKLGITNSHDAIITIDKLDKVGAEGVRKELGSKGITREQSDKLLDLLLVQGTNAGKVAFLENELGEEALRDIKILLGHLQCEVEFAPSLARGLAYYTGTVYEAFAIDSAIKGSLCGGGRYDKLVSALTSGAVDQPAVGISFGIEPIGEVLKERTHEGEDSLTNIFIIPIGNTVNTCVGVLHDLRDLGVSCVMDTNARGISKNLEYANKLRIPLVLIIGEKDIEQGIFTLKNLKTGEERKVSASDRDGLAVEIKTQLTQ